MTRRSFQLRLLSRLTPFGVVAPQPRPSETPTSLQCTPQDLTWEDLLGRR